MQRQGRKPMQRERTHRRARGEPCTSRLGKKTRVRSTLFIDLQGQSLIRCISNRAASSISRIVILPALIVAWALSSPEANGLAGSTEADKSAWHLFAKPKSASLTNETKEHSARHHFQQPIGYRTKPARLEWQYASDLDLDRHWQGHRIGTSMSSFMIETQRDHSSSPEKQHALECHRYCWYRLCYPILYVVFLRIKVQIILVSLVYWATTRVVHPTLTSVR